MTQHGKHDNAQRGIGRRGFLSGVLAAGGLSLAGLSGAAVTEAAESHWPHARKYGFATAYDHSQSMSDLPKVWYTLTKGAITGVRYPRLDCINTTAIEFVVTDGNGYAARTYNIDKTDDGTTDDPVDRQAEMVADDALVFEQTMTDAVNDGHDWTLTVEYVADTEADALVADVSFEGGSQYDVFVVGEFALGHGLPGNTASVAGSGSSRRIVGTGQTGTWITEPGGGSYDVATALTADGGFDWASVDSAGGSVADILSGTIPSENGSASGSVHVAGRLLSGSGQTTLAMGFAQGGDTSAATTAAQDALSRGYDSVRASFVDGWRSYLDAIDTPSSVVGDDRLHAHYNASVMALKSGESKHAQLRGASVAAPSIPWGQTRQAGEAAQVGYSHCWPRDLYHVYSTLEAIGDIEGAIHATEYLFEFHQKSDGSVEQNTTFDGKGRWGAVQMDQVAYPLIMAYQVDERHGIAPDSGEVSYDYENVRLGAEYLVNNGPKSSQQRWEENRGYSPQAMAAEIAGLLCAAELADAAGNSSDAQSWRETADEWSQQLESLTVSTGGPFADGFDFEDYYVRVNPEYDDLDAEHASVYVKNRINEANFPVNEVVDPSFLELVRLGVRPHDDPVVEQSVDVVDDQLRVDTPNGPGWYRYNHDAYGQKWNGDGFFAEGEEPYKGNIGRLWPFLSGERAEYELLAGGQGDLDPASLLGTMAEFANEGRMLSEQVWDRETETDFDWTIGEGTGAATPLLWCHAQYARLCHCIDAGHPVETPRAVREHFGIEFPEDSPDPDPAFVTVESVTAPDSTQVGSQITLSASLRNTGDTDGTRSATASLDGSTVGETEVTLGAGASTTVSFTVELTDVSAGAHTLTVDSGDDNASTDLQVTDTTQGLSVSLSESGSAGPDGQVTVDVIAAGADAGVAGADLGVTVEDPSVATITGVSAAGNGYERTRIASDGSSCETAFVTESSLGTGTVTVATVTLVGERSGEMSLSVTVDAIGDPAGNSYAIAETSGTTISVSAAPPALVGDSRPTDPDGDGVYEDVNGDGTIDIADVQALFDNFEGDPAQSNPAAFDLNGDDKLDVTDVVRLFGELS